MAFVQYEFLFSITQNAGLPVTEGQLDDLVDMMDDDGNGEVDLSSVATFQFFKKNQWFFDTRSKNYN